jgi:hypothetical protein
MIVPTPKHNREDILSTLGACRRRTLVCSVIAASLIAGCKAQNENPDSIRVAAKSSASTATRVTSAVTYLSAMKVANGDFTDAELIRKILDTARTLKDSDWDNVHDRRDERRLLSGDCAAGSNKCVPGPFTRIVARKNVYKTKLADIGKGHIVGKLMNLEVDQTIPYVKLALHAGTPEAYWWIGTLPNPSDTARRILLSVYVPSDWSASKPAKWRLASVMATDPSNATFSHAHSSARFLWNDNDDETWVSCVTNGCCQPPAALDTVRTTSQARLDSAEPN